MIHKNPSDTWEFILKILFRMIALLHRNKNQLFEDTSGVQLKDSRNLQIFKSHISIPSSSLLQQTVTNYWSLNSFQMPKPRTTPSDVFFYLWRQRYLAIQEGKGRKYAVLIVVQINPTLNSLIWSRKANKNLCQENLSVPFFAPVLVKKCGSVLIRLPRS